MSEAVWAALLPSAPVLGVRVDGAWLVSTLALLKSGFGEPALRFAAKAAVAPTRRLLPRPSHRPRRSK